MNSSITTATGRCLHVEQLEGAETEHRALDLAEVDERPVLHGGGERGVNAVEMIDAPEHDQCVQRHGHPRWRVDPRPDTQREVRILRCALDLEEHAERELTTPPSTPRA